MAAKVIENGGVERKSFIANMKQVKVPCVGSSMYQFDEKGKDLAPPFVTKPAQWYKGRQ